MNISSRCEYACRAVVELARNEGSGEPLTATVIADRRAIPEKYLVHILLQLKRAGIVRSVRGAYGGYLLARSPDDISLLDVIQAVDGPVLDPLPVGGAGSGELDAAWKKIAEETSQILASVTVRGLLEQSKQSHMYYI